MTITVDGREINAVAQGIQAGLHLRVRPSYRRAVWPIEERAVDTARPTCRARCCIRHSRSRPSRRHSPAKGVSLEDANDLTPEIHALAVAEMRRRANRVRDLGASGRRITLIWHRRRCHCEDCEDWGAASRGPHPGVGRSCLYIAIVTDILEWTVLRKLTA